jgi:hypothetical protein
VSRRRRRRRRDGKKHKKRLLELPRLSALRRFENLISLSVAKGSGEGMEK